MIRRVIYDVEFRVLVKDKLNPSDSLLVTGSSEELGEWMPKRCVPLSRVETNENGEIWSANVKINSQKKILYRYVIGQIIRNDESMNLIIKRWESFKHARQLILDHQNLDFDETQNVMNSTNIDPQTPDDFPAIFGVYQGVTRTDMGWLTGQTEIQLRFHSDPLQIWSNKLRNSKISLKVSPIDLNYQQENEETTGDTNSQPTTMTSRVFIQSAMLRLSGCEANIQNDYGTVIEKDDYMVVKIQTFEPENIAYHIDFYAIDENPTMRKHVGFAYVLPIHANSELGENKRLHRIVPIIGLKHNPIGQIKIDLLLVTPLEGADQVFFVTPSKYWRQGRRPVNVGHRGLGKTNAEHIPLKHQSSSSSENSKPSHHSSTSSLSTPNGPVQTKFIRENTLASFQAAFKLGFDFVEFDVQLSKDKIPVVYHDFQVAITLKRKVQEPELFLVPVKDLTLPQLQSLKIYHASRTNVNKVDDELDDDEAVIAENLNDNAILTRSASNYELEEKKFRSLFPTLHELFEKLDPHLGFNVEIKYAMEYREGGSEQNHFFERNEYIDCILRCLIKYAGKRVIVLSTFDPDCASMLRLKQNLFPVLFLTQGDKGDWPQFLDMRTWSIDIGLCFAVAENISGLAAPAVDILSNPDFVQHVKKNGKLLFIWGDESSNKDVSKCLMDLRVDGLIFDHAADAKDENSTSENLFISEEREELEILNSWRQKQLEIQHHHLLQELERIKSARNAANHVLSRMASNQNEQDHSLVPEASSK